MRLGLRIGIEDWDRGLGIADLGLGSGNWDWVFGFGIGTRDWELFYSFYYAYFDVVWLLD